jgi:hypothetical protein
MAVSHSARAVVEVSEVRPEVRRSEPPALVRARHAGGVEAQDGAQERANCTSDSSS